MRTVLLLSIMVGLVMPMVACEEKVEAPSPAVGELEFYLDPEALEIEPKVGDYNVEVRAEEKGGVAVSLDTIKTVMTYLDGERIKIEVMSQQMDITEKYTRVLTYEKREEFPLPFWHFAPGEAKGPFNWTVKVGEAFEWPEGFKGLYLPLQLVDLAVKKGKSGFKEKISYKGSDKKGNSLEGSFSLRLML